jgi:hypothetical protein
MKRTEPGEPSPPPLIIPAIPKQDVPARLAALPSADIRDLKEQWRSLFGTEPPPYNRRFLERRIAYRILELAYGGLKPETIARLEALGEQIDGGNITLRRIRQDQRPIAGTRLLREYQGVEHVVTVTRDGYEYPGEHAAIIPQALWNQVHEIMATNPHMRAGLARNRSPALLRGLIFGADGRALSPTHTRKQGRLYRYYVSQSVLKGGADDAPYRRLPAGEIEALVLDQVRALLRQPEVVVGTWRTAQAEAPDLGEDTVRDALPRFDPVWSELFPAEQERLIRLLVQRVVVGDAGAQISLNLEGLASLARDLSQPKRIAA